MKKCYIDLIYSNADDSNLLGIVHRMDDDDKASLYSVVVIPG